MRILLLVVSCVGAAAVGCGNSGEGDGSGSDSGSSGGSESDGSGSGSGTGGENGECQSADDCQLFEDCCSCAAIPNSETPDYCDADCEQTQCSRWGIDTVMCRAGTCVLQRWDCDPARANCAEPPPDCEQGMIPSVVDGCWGECVPHRFCDGVDDCSRCAESQVCMTLGGIESGVSCQPLPAPCEDQADPEACACQWLCPEGMLQTCSVTEDGIECVKMGG